MNKRGGQFKIIIATLFAASIFAVQATETRALHIKCSDYLSKIIESKSEAKQNFESLELSEFDPGILDWIYDLDQDLESQFDGDLDAEFEFTIGDDHKISSLKFKSIKVQELEEEEQSFEAYKNFVARFLDFEFPAYWDSHYGNAKSLQDYKFKISTKHLYVHRDVSFDQLSKSDSSKLDFEIKDSSEAADLLQALVSSQKLKVKLLKPMYIDFPQVGEDILLVLNKINQKSTTGYPVDVPKNIFIKAKLVDVSNKKMIMQIEKIILEDKASQQVLLARRDSFWSYQQDRELDTQRVLGSAWIGGMQAGIASSIGSYGIAPAATAVLGLSSGILHEMQSYHSYDLSKGDNFTLVRVGGAS